MQLKISLSLLFTMFSISSCLGSSENYNDSTLVKKINSQIAQYEANNSYYTNNIAKPKYKYPTYDPYADNPIYYNNMAKPDYHYSTYDPYADNPTYQYRVVNNFDDRIYPDFYPVYDSSADNPIYPDVYSNSSPKQTYQYPTYDPSADNPINPPPSNSQFSTPMFDRPMFENTDGASSGQTENENAVTKTIKGIMY